MRALLIILIACCAGALAAQDAPPPVVSTVAQGYLYIEPYKARVEVLFDLRTAASWLRKSYHDSDTLSPADQAELRISMESLAANWCKVYADDGEMKGSLTGVAFIKGKPGATLPLVEKEAPKVQEVMMGVMFQFAIPGGPTELEVRWRELLSPVSALPFTLFFGRETEVKQLVPALPSLRWQNNGRLPKPRPLAAVPEIVMPEVFAVPLMMIIWILFGLSVYVTLEIRDKKFPGGMLPFFAIWVLGIVITAKMEVAFTDPFAVKNPMVASTADAEKILEPLLRNAYRAFDYEREKDIYDLLAQSVHGELLRTLYLQTIQALTVEGADGTRAHVTELSVTVDKSRADGTGFIADTEWTALGRVGHWGHEHPRVTRYKAVVTVAPQAGAWKITALDVKEERRL
jgi:hypothetical protein